MNQKFFTLLKVLGATCFLTACQHHETLKGRVVRTEDLKLLKVGLCRKEEAHKILGVPSCVLAYDPLVWYYLNFLNHQSLFFRPEIKDNRSFALLFDPKGVLQKVVLSENNLPFYQALDYQKLPCEHRCGFWPQLLRNVGRFSSKTGKQKER